jgi:hypothetical protein
MTASRIVEVEPSVNLMPEELLFRISTLLIRGEDFLTLRAGLPAEPENSSKEPLNWVPVAEPSTLMPFQSPGAGEAFPLVNLDFPAFMLSLTMICPSGPDLTVTPSEIVRDAAPAVEKPQFKQGSRRNIW